MFHEIPERIRARMQELEELDARDRQDGTPRQQRLRQIPPETGQFIALMAAGTPPGDWIEIGTSGGYSTLWLSLACRETGREITTFEVLPEKVELAKQTFHSAGVEEVVRLVQGDAVHLIDHFENIAFCFLDAEKEVYLDCYETVIPRMVRGGWLVADNAINFEERLRPMLDRALSDERVDAMIVPVGTGQLVCRKR
jgi:predicted O-methyltransferase YrrM